MEQKKGAGRIAKWDNARWILITLVVICHFFENYLGNPVANSLFFYVYTFHMPAFFLIAGLFSKKTVEDRRIDKVAPYILIYIFIKIVNWIVQMIIYGKYTSINWFVDFNYPNATGEMIDSEMGEIPKGWRVVDLRTLSEVISKGTTPIKSEKESLLENVYFLKVKDITDNGNIKYDSLEKISSEIHTTVLNRSQLKTDDLLYSIAGTIGRVTILPKQLDNSNCNQALAFIRLREKNKYLEYVHQWIQTSQIKNKINSSIVQGVQANVSLTVLGALKIVTPDNTTLEKWISIIKPIYKKINDNYEQIQTLDETRDSLLPKLMSGQKRVFEYYN
jgi:hypothetical protein